jgi:lactoylglutathione lyase
MKMIHTCYRVKDLQASMDFYMQAFEMVESRRMDFPQYEFTLVYLKFPGDDYELELTYNYGHEGYELGDGYGHIALGCEDIDALHARLKQEGYEVDDMSGLPGKPNQFFFIVDPDGYQVEVVRQ